MQQKQQHRQQCRPSAAEHPVGQQPAEKTPADKEQMGNQVTRQRNVTTILQAQNALNYQQRQLKCHAIITVGGFF